MTHEQRVRDFLNEHDPAWATQKDRGWHFDNPTAKGDPRYFEQIRKREVPFSPKREASTAYWDRPRLTAEQKDAKWMIEWVLANPDALRPALTNPQDDEDIAAKLRAAFGEERAAAILRKPTPQQPKVRDNRDAVAVLSLAYGVSGVRAAAILKMTPGQARKELYRIRQQTPADFADRLTQRVNEALGKDRPVIVSMPSLTPEPEPVARAVTPDCSRYGGAFVDGSTNRFEGAGVTVEWKLGWIPSRVHNPYPAMSDRTCQLYDMVAG